MINVTDVKLFKRHTFVFIDSINSISKLQPLQVLKCFQMYCIIVNEKTAILSDCVLIEGGDLCRLINFIVRGVTEKVTTQTILKESLEMAWGHNYFCLHDK